MKRLYYNGNIITLSDLRTVDSIIEENGKIIFAGKYSDINLSENVCKKINLNKKAMIPAFIDSHSHILQQTISMRFVSLANCKSFDEIINTITEFKNTNYIKTDTWLIGVGYDHENLKEHKHPDKNILDKISTENPVLISHASGHMGCANSMGLRIAGINKDTPDPAGGIIGKSSDDGEPTGYLEEKAFINISSIIPPAEDSEILELLNKAQNMYASYGITTAQEGFMKKYEFDILSKAAQENCLFLDTVGYVDIKDNAYIIEDNPQYKNYINNLKLGGYKLFLDGSPQGRTAWITKPYEKSENQPDDYCGYPIYKDDEVKAFVTKADNDKCQLITHCNGDAAIDQLLNAHKKPSEHRDVIIHAQLMRYDQLKKAKELNMIPDFFIAHTYYWGDVHIKNFGKQRADVISPAKSAEKFGLPFTFHQDTPVLPPDMINTVFCAVNRVTISGEKLSQKESISALSALKAVTANSAFQYNEEHEKGTLEIGKNADMVILDKDITSCSPEGISSVKVLETIKSGNTIYKAK